MAQTKGKGIVTAEVSKDVIAQLDERKKTENRSRSEIINRAILFYLAHAEIEPVEDMAIPKIKKPKKGE